MPLPRAAGANRWTKIAERVASTTLDRTWAPKTRAWLQGEEPINKNKWLNDHNTVVYLFKSGIIYKLYNIDYHNDNDE